MRSLLTGVAVALVVLLAACGATVNGHGVRAAVSTPAQPSSSSVPSSGAVPSVTPRISGTQLVGNPRTANWCGGLDSAALGVRLGATALLVAPTPVECDVLLTGATRLTVLAYVVGPYVYDTSGTARTVDGFEVFQHPATNDHCDASIDFNGLAMSVHAVANTAAPDLCVARDLVVEQFADAVAQRRIRQRTYGRTTLTTIDVCAKTDLTTVYALPGGHELNQEDLAFGNECEFSSDSYEVELYVGIEPAALARSLPTISSGGHPLVRLGATDSSCHTISVQGAVPGTMSAEAIESYVSVEDGTPGAPTGERLCTAVTDRLVAAFLDATKRH